MLGELDTYTISQFIPMTAEVYFRLFERLNEAAWPWQLPLFAAAALVPVLVWRNRGLFAAGLMALCWFLVAIVFHFRFHAELNWAGPYFGWAFLLQGLLVLVVGGRGGLRAEPGVRAVIGAVVIAAALVLYPLLGPLAGRSWAGLEVAGTAPDPTAMLTLGVLLTTVRIQWLLVPVPVLWCLYSGATWWGLGWSPGLANVLLVLIFLFSLALRNR